MGRSKGNLSLRFDPPLSESVLYELLSRQWWLFWFLMSAATGAKSTHLPFDLTIVSNKAPERSEPWTQLPGRRGKPGSRHQQALEKLIVLFG